MVAAYQASPYNCTPIFPFITNSDGGNALQQLFNKVGYGGPTWLIHPDREYDEGIAYYNETQFAASIDAALADDCPDGNTSPTKYTLTVTNGSGSGEYSENDAFSITAKDSTGYTFSMWTGDISVLSSASSKTTTVTIGTANATVTATYTKD